MPLSNYSELPVLGEFDVVVCGGGPAGLGATLAAARSGAKTLLLERQGILGGLWTTGLVTPFFDAENKQGISRQIRSAMSKQGYQLRWNNPDPDRHTPGVYVYHAGYLAEKLDRWVTQAGATVLLHTITDEAVLEDGCVKGVVLHSKSGPQMVRAKVVIDCTGDGDIAASAGCQYEMGRETDNACQPATLFALVGGAPNEIVYPPAILSAIKAAGGELSYAHPYLFAQPGAPGTAIFMCTHLYNLDATDAAAVSQGEMQGRREIVQALDWLAASGDAMFKDIHLIHFAGQIGIRESRRILGRAYISAADILAGKSYPDGICNPTFNIDIHSIDKEEETGLETTFVPAYQIPYGCLVPRGRDGILVAGRCISGDHVAHASYRVTGNAAALGEAAGIAAALASRDGVAPGELDGETVKAQLDAYYDRMT